MLFFLKGLVSRDGQQQKVEFVFQAPDEQTLRKVLKQAWIVILSLSPWEEGIEGYDVYFVLKNKEGEVKGFLKDKSLKEAFVYLFEELGLKDVSWVDSRSNPVEPQKIQKLVEYFKTKVSQPQKKKTETLDPQKYKNLREVMDQTVADVNELVQRLQGKVPTTYITKLKSKADELIRLKLSANVDKILDLIEEIFKLMEEAELEYYNTLQKQEFSSTQDKLISELDVLVEYEKSKKAASLKKAGVKNLSWDMKIYGLLGEKGIYIKLLFKELFLRLKAIDGVIRYLVDFVILFAFFYIALALIVVLWKIVVNGQLVQWTLFSNVLFLAIVWMIFTLAKYTLKKGNIVWNLAIVIGAVALSGIAIYLAKANLAL